MDVASEPADQPAPMGADGAAAQYVVAPAEVLVKAPVSTSSSSGW
ncbi:hypothetical protein [Microbacterium sp. 18062]|nr:hypothetical protein [Microbacterium sp. 18062]